MYKAIEKLVQTYTINNFVPVLLSYVGLGYIVYSGSHFYMFSGKCWSNFDSNKKLKGRFSNLIAKFFNDVRISNSVTGTSIRKDSALTRIENQLIQTGLSTLINMTSYSVSDDDFLSGINRQFELIPYDNGILELKTGTLREFNPTDLFTFTLPWSFVENVSHSRVLSILSPMFPFSDELDYAINVFASFLNENLPNDKVYFLIGSGSNGKSLLVSMLLAAFKQLGMACPLHLFCSEQTDIHSATPLFAQLKGSRLAVVSEPQEAKFKSTVLKRMAGMDTITSRDLFSNCVEKFVLRTNFVVCTNAAPTFTENDGGIWRRLEMIPFRRKFVFEPKKLSEAKLMFLCIN